MEDLIQRDSTFRYRLLSRLQQDCEYYLGYGNRHKRALWANDEKQQIQTMIALHNSFPEGEKPEWLTMNEIKEYQRRMISPNPSELEEYED